MKKLVFFPLAVLALAACESAPTATDFAPADAPVFASASLGKLSIPAGVKVDCIGEACTASWTSVANAAQYQVVIQGAGATGRVLTPGVSHNFNRPHSSNNWCVKVMAIPAPGSGYQPSQYSDCFGGTGASEQCLATAAPTISLATTVPIYLWAPNKRTETRTFTGTVDWMGDTDGGAVSFYVLDEYNAANTAETQILTGAGTSWTTPDVSFVVSRKGTDQDGRHYDLYVTAANCFGTTTVPFTSAVIVPHNQSGMANANES